MIVLRKPELTYIPLCHRGKPLDIRHTVMVPTFGPPGRKFAESVEVDEMQAVKMHCILGIQHLLLLHVAEHPDVLLHEAPTDVCPQTFYSDVVDGSTGNG